MPALMAAEQRGVFRGSPSRPYYLERAGWLADQGPMPHPPIYDSEGRIRQTSILPKREPDQVANLAAQVEALSKRITAETGRRVGTERRAPQREYNALQKRAKALGINGFGMKRDELEAAVKAKDEQHADPAA